MVSRAAAHISDWLRGRVDGRRHTQKELAVMLTDSLGREVCQSTISNLMRARSKPRGDLMIALKKSVLAIEVEWWSEAVPAATGTDG